MKTSLVLCVLLVCASVPRTTVAADNLVERLATCQDSWLDWKDDPVRMKTLGDAFSAAFERKSDGAPWTAKSHTLVVGLPVAEAYPENVGMGVGFSVLVDATFDVARQHVEKATAKTVSHCEIGEGMRTCDLKLAEKRVLTLLGPADETKAGKTPTTLIGCYYYYEK